jgi:HlyD family secretion protein
VFGVELTLKNPQGLAKPGMPADGRILVPETVEEQGSRGAGETRVEGGQGRK